MRALARALRDMGERLPVPWHELDSAAPIPGDLVIMLAAPRVGKSMMALTWAVHLAERGLPVLLLTMDTSYEDQAIRLVAMLNGKTQDEVAADKVRWMEWLEEQRLPIRFLDDRTYITVDDIPDLLKAEREYLGEDPAFIIIDVVNDLIGGEEENVGVVRHIFRELKRVARRSHAVVLALHHVKRGPKAAGDAPIGLDDGLYAGEGVAQIVIGAWKESQTRIRVNVIKNRRGPEGIWGKPLMVDYASASIRSPMGSFS